ncbi:MAG: nitroreductase family protein [Rikenellaceae bacterium]
MKNIWQIITLLLAVALVILSIKITMEKEPEKRVEIDTKQVGIDLIMTRSSVRSYTTEKPDATTIETILKAGMAAPTAMNKQPWQFVVVNDRATLDSIPTFVRGAHMARKAQVAIVVCGSVSEAASPTSWLLDCSAASENILLAAHALGLGAVWCGAYPNDAADRVGQMQKLLNLPEDVYALNVIVMGYPDTEPTVKDKWNPAKVHYNKY